MWAATALPLAVATMRWLATVSVRPLLISGGDCVGVTDGGCDVGASVGDVGDSVGDVMGDVMGD